MWLHHAKHRENHLELVHIFHVHIEVEGVISKLIKLILGKGNWVLQPLFQLLSLFLSLFLQFLLSLFFCPLLGLGFVFFFVPLRLENRGFLLC